MRAALFVDAQSLWFNARRFGESKGWQRAQVDYDRLKTHLLAGRDLAACHVYIQERDGMEHFTRALEHMGYTIHTIDRRDLTDGHLGDEMMMTYDQWDVAVIAASEGNYTEVFRASRADGKQIEVHAFPIDCPIMKMAKETDRFQPLPDDMLQFRPPEWQTKRDEW